MRRWVAFNSPHLWTATPRGRNQDEARQSCPDAGVAAGTVLLPCAATAQSAKPTADQDIQLSAFGAASGDFTGLSGGKNFSITAGGDLAPAPWHGMRPTLELRGRYPTDHGLIDSQKDVLGGLRLDFLLGHRFRPYGDFLFGRGQMNYGSPDVPGQLQQLRLLPHHHLHRLRRRRLRLRPHHHLAIKVDAQIERWGAAPTSSGQHLFHRRHLGLVYFFNFDRPQPLTAGLPHRLNSSRSRLVCARLTGISVFFGSSMRNW